MVRTGLGHRVGGVIESKRALPAATGAWHTPWTGWSLSDRWALVPWGDRHVAWEISALARGCASGTSHPGKTNWFGRRCQLSGAIHLSPPWLDRHSRVPHDALPPAPPGARFPIPLDAKTRGRHVTSTPTSRPEEARAGLLNGVHSVCPLRPPLPSTVSLSGGAYARVVLYGMAARTAAAATPSSAAPSSATQPPAFHASRLGAVPARPAEALKLHQLRCLTGASSAITAARRLSSLLPRRMCSDGCGQGRPVGWCPSRGG